MLRETFLDTADVAARLLRDPAVAAKWREPSALADFSVAGLARHLANQVTAMPGFLARPAGTDPVPVLDHYTRNSWVTSGVDSDDNRDIRARSEERAAGTTPEALAGEVDGALAVVRALSRRERVPETIAAF
jgi:Mycothiol maleylpyruvate isomerase N-terminal domain